MVLPQLNLESFKLLINDAEIVSNENIIKQIPENTQLTATQDFNINQFITEATTTNEQFITD